MAKCLNCGEEYKPGTKKGMLCPRCTMNHYILSDAKDSLWYTRSKDGSGPIDISANEYQRLCLRTKPKGLSPSDSLLNGLMGLNGEAGECIDILKKTLFQGHTMDEEHLAKELGDVAWYLAISADALGMSLSDIFMMNVEKLESRYGRDAKFSSAKSINRKEGDI